MHFEIMSLELFLFDEGFTAILTRVPGMDLAVMLFQLNFTLEGFTTFFTSILNVRILRHMIFSFQCIPFILELPKNGQKASIARCSV
jgi:hypothetical protein